MINPTNGQVTITNATNSTSQTTGALVTPGGIGISQDFTLGGNMALDGPDIIAATLNADLHVFTSGTGRVVLSNGNPTASFHASTKIYADTALVNGIAPKQSCQAKTTTADLLALAGTYTAFGAGPGKYLQSNLPAPFPTLDGGVVLSTLNRVLFADTSALTDAGIYELTDPGSLITPWILTRTSDCDNSVPGEVFSGITTYIVSGAAHGNQTWVLVTPVVTLDVTPLAWTVFQAGNPVNPTFTSMTVASNLTASFVNPQVLATNAGNLNLQPAAGSSLTSTTPVTLNPTGTGTVNLNNGSGTGTTNIGSSTSGISTITGTTTDIQSTTGAVAVNPFGNFTVTTSTGNIVLDSTGSGPVNLNNGTGTGTSNIGSSTSGISTITGTTTNIQSTTGAVAVNPFGNFTVTTSTGNTVLDSTGSGPVNINNGTGTGATNIGSSTSGILTLEGSTISVVTGAVTGTLDILTTNSQSGAVTILNGTTVSSNFNIASGSGYSGIFSLLNGASTTGTLNIFSGAAASGSLFIQNSLLTSAAQGNLSLLSGAVSGTGTGGTLFVSNSNVSSATATGPNVTMMSGTLTAGSSGTFTIGGGSVSGTVTLNPLNFGTATLTQSTAGTLTGARVQIGSTAVLANTVGTAVAQGNLIDVLNNTTLSNFSGAISRKGIVNLLNGTTDTLTAGAVAYGGDLNVATDVVQTTGAGTATQAEINLQTGPVLGTAVGGVMTMQGSQLHLGSSTSQSLSVHTSDMRIPNLSRNTEKNVSYLVQQESTGQITRAPPQFLASMSAVRASFDTIEWTKQSLWKANFSSAQRKTFISDALLTLEQKHPSVHANLFYLQKNSRGVTYLACGQGASNTLAFSNDGYTWNGLGTTVFSTRALKALYTGSRWIALGQGTHCLAYTSKPFLISQWTGLNTGPLGGDSPASTCGYAACLAWLRNSTMVVIGGGDGVFAGGPYVATTGGLRSITVALNTIFQAGQRITVTGTGAGNYVIESVVHGASTVITTHDGTFAAATSQITDNRSTLAFSLDHGITWRGLGTDIFATRCNALAWNGHVIVAAGNDVSNTLAYSLNGMDWTGLGNTIFSTEGICVEWNGKMFVAGGSGTNTWAFSNDGISWTANGSSVLTTSVSSLAWTGNMWFAAGNGAADTLAYSFNGLAWTGLGNTLFSTVGNHVLWTGSRLLGCGQGAHSLAFSQGFEPDAWEGLGTSIFSTSAFSITENFSSLHPFHLVKDKIIVSGSTNVNTKLAFSEDQAASFSAVASGTGFTGDAYQICHLSQLSRWIVGTDAGLFYSDTEGRTWTFLGSALFTTTADILCFAKDRVFGGEIAGGISGYSFDGITWTALSFSQLSCVAWNGRVFVATCFNAAMRYSYDGINWTSVTWTVNPLATSARGVAWNGSLWCAVGGGAASTTAVSPDGITWTGALNIANTANPLATVAANPSGTFLTAYSLQPNASNRSIFSSLDGVNWTEHTGTIPAGNTGFAVCRDIKWVGTRWLLGTGYADTPVANLLSSLSDGSTVTALTTPFGQTGTTLGMTMGIGWNESVQGAPHILHPVLACGSGTYNTLALSYDNGASWEGVGKRTFSTQANQACWNGDKWVAVGSGTNALAYSYDGVEWTGLGTGAFGGDSAVGTAVAWNHSLFVAGCTVGVFATPRPVLQGTYSTLTIASTSTFSRGQRITVTGANAGSFVIDRVFTQGSLTTLQILTPTSIAFDSTSTITDNRSSLIYSSDGVHWTGLGNILFSSVYVLHWAVNTWVAGGAGSNTLAYSLDGTNWTGLGTAVFSTDCRGIAFGAPQRFVAVGTGSTHNVATSSDGITWTGQGVSSFGAGGSGRSCTFGDALTQYDYIVTAAGLDFVTLDSAAGIFSGMTVEITGPGAGFYTVNSITLGTTLNLSSAGTTFTTSSKVKIGSTRRFVMTGTTSGSLSVNAWSFTGLSWITSFSAIANDVRSIVCTGRGFVSAGQGSIHHFAFSPDGENWTGAGTNGFSVVNHVSTASQGASHQMVAHPHEPLEMKTSSFNTFPALSFSLFPLT
jgi:hypothetical protein